MLPSQVQLIHFNQELYGNLSAASRGPNGLAILSLFVNVSPGEIPKDEGEFWTLVWGRGSLGGPDSWVLGEGGLGA